MVNLLSFSYLRFILCSENFNEILNDKIRATY